MWTALVFNPAAVTVVEEASATYTVELSSQPDGNVTVAISGASGEVTFDTDSTTPGTQTTALTFTTTNWDDAQTVTVLAAADGDTANDTATLTHSASGGGYGSVTGDVEVTVTDNDTPGLVLDPTSLTVAEGGSGTYTVKLATQPTGNVTVTVAGASGEVTFDTDGDTGGNQNTLSFTDSTWSTAQTVTVSAGQDNDADDDSATLTHSASGGGYGSVSGNVAVTVTDDDTASVVTTAPDDTATEGSTTDTATFTVNLNTEPSSDVTVTVTAPAGLTLDGPDSATTFTSSEDLTFTTGNWSTAQTVTVRATDDNDDSPIGRELTVTWTSASSDSNYNNGSGDAAEITVVDNDATTVTLAGAAGDVAEGATKTFTVTLNRGLVNGETLGVPLTFGGDATRGTDYMTACPDTLPTGVTCNDLDDTSLTPTVTFTGPSTGATATTVTLTLTAATDSTTEAGGESVVIGFGTLNASSGTGLGGGASGTDNLEDFNITDPDASAPTLEISGVPKRITTRAAFTVTFTFSESVTGFVTGDVSVTNGDTSSFSGSGSSYTVVVTPNADADVTVTVDADSATDGTNTGPPADVVATAVFGAPAAPSVTATAGNAAVTLSWTDPGDDTITGYEYRQGVQSSPVTWGSWTPVPNSDKDTTSHTVTGLTDGTEYYFQVRAVSDAVMGEPSAEENPDTVVTPVAVNAPAAPTGLTAAAGDTEVDLSWTAPGGTFTGYQVQQGTGDPLVWGTWTALSGTGTSHKVTGLTNGTAYSFRVRAVNSAVLGAATDAATATPRGAAGVTTTQPGDRQVTEGDTSDTATFTVVLDTQPSSDVTVTVTAPTGLELDGPDAGSTFGSSEALTFTDSNWGTAQTVTVRATDDNTDSPIGRELTVTYSTSSSDSDYSGLSGNAATVTVVDDDPTTVTLAGAAGNITEGETKTFTVTLGRGLVNGETLGVPLTFGGGATRGTDYTTVCPTTLPTGVTCANLDSGNATVTFTGASGRTTATTVTLTLTAATDSTTESGGETVVIGLGTLNANSGTGLGGGASGTDNLADFSITDPDSSAPTVPITEDGENPDPEPEPEPEPEPAPRLAATDITETGATLVAANVPGGVWRYRRTLPEGGECGGPQSGESAALTGLAAATEYAYALYADSACAIELDSVGFTTGPSTNAALAGLALATRAGGAAALAPAFSPEADAYSASLPFAAASALLTPRTAHPDATARVGPPGGPLAAVPADGDGGVSVPLAVGVNEIVVEVTAADGATRRTVILSITRAAPGPLDDTAAQTHLFPLFADGGGFRSRILIADAGGGRARCGLTLRGAGLDAVRFAAEPVSALAETADGARIRFRRPGGEVALNSAGAGELAFGYAKLDCDGPVAAQLLLSLEVDGALSVMAHQSPAERGRAFSLPGLPAPLRLGLAFANDGELGNLCVVEAAEGRGVVAVPPGGTAFRLLGEIVALADGGGTGPVAVRCDRPAALLALPLGGSVFTALAPAVVDADGAVDAADVDGAAAGSAGRRPLLPLVLDGGGFRSRLAAVNLAAGANRCELRLSAAGGLSGADFAAAGAGAEGVGGFTLALAEPSDQASLDSRGGEAPAFGHAALECEGPAALWNLIVLDGPDGPAGMMAPGPAQPAREMRFRAPPAPARLGLAIANGGGARTSCHVALAAADGASVPPRGFPLIPVPARATAIRFLDELFAVPAGFAGGAATLRCDHPVGAVAVPVAGAAFTAVPPIIPGFETVPEEGASSRESSN